MGYKNDTDRPRLIRLLHVAKRDLRMVDADYRAVLLQASSGAHDSSKDMATAELELALAHMKRCGFKIRIGTKVPARKEPSRPLAGDPESKKIRALWLMLHELGAVKNPSEAALAAYVKRITRVEALQWVTAEQAETLIETMKKWALRYLPGAIETLKGQVQSKRLGFMDAARLNTSLNAAFNRKTFVPMSGAWQDLKEVIAAQARTNSEAVPS